MVNHGRIIRVNGISGVMFHVAEEKLPGFRLFHTLLVFKYCIMIHAEDENSNDFLFFLEYEE